MNPRHRMLIAKAKELAERYRTAVADLVAVIAEIDRTRLWAPSGFSSLFEFCVRELLLSEDDAYKLIRSARTSHAHPEVLSYLADGLLTTRKIAVIAPLEKAPDFQAILDKAQSQSVHELENLVAARNPQARPPDLIKPIAEDDYTFRFAGDAALRALIERAKEVLSPKYPIGRLEDVLREALSHFLEACDPLRREASERRATRNPRAREVPPSVRDLVWKRDEGRCAWVGQDGRRCEATRFLELDHRIPWALGGRSDDPENIRLLCRAHNQWEAKRIFGEKAASS